MRSAPAPNIAPIPGMCPGVVVLAGNGDGGGGGAGAGNGGKGKKGAGTGKGENDPESDKKKAAEGECGAGEGGGHCPVHDKSGTAGHPVDVVTGRAFTDGHLDLFLSGTIELRFVRAYSSGAAGRDVGLGFGWSHSFAWQIEVRHRSVRVWTGDGRAVDFDLPALHGATLGRGGWVLHREVWGYRLDCGDELWRVFSEAEPDGRGFRLTALQDSNGNRIALTHEDGRLVEMQDSVGRTVRVRSTPEGRIAALEVRNAADQGRWVTFATYRYDSAGDLVTARVEDEGEYRFTYDDHLLRSETIPLGTTFHFVYDAQRRCVETWGAPPAGRDPSLSDDLSPFLADGQTRAKGIYHCRLNYYPDGFTEVIDSIKIRRYFGDPFGTVAKVVSGSATTTRTLDARGHLIEHVDPLGASTRWERDVRGRTLKLTNAEGRVTTIRRDEAGRVVEIVAPNGGVTAAERDPFGRLSLQVNPLGAVSTYKRDARGQVVEEVFADGTRAQYRYDAHANIVEMVMPNGGTWRWSYDFYGHLLARTDPVGATTRYVYNLRGQLQAVYDANGGVRRFHYMHGLLSGYTDADGRAERYEWGGFNTPWKIVKANGDIVRLQYNREGWVVAGVNERGQICRLTYGNNREILVETGFDGRTTRYRRDALGRAIQVENALGERTTFALNLLGEVVGIEYADGTAEEFRRDLLGNVTAATGPVSAFELERDLLGQVIRETQRIDGIEHTIRTAHDLMGNRVSRESSLGFHEEIRRDALGNRVASRLDGSLEVLHERNVMGQEVRRRLPAHGAIDSVYDEMGWLTRRTAARAGAFAPGADEPEWVGSVPEGLSVEKSFRYSLAGEVLERRDRTLGAVMYEYDPRGRLTAAIPAGLAAQLFSYDGASNVGEHGAVGAARRYSPGNRLLERGDVEYVWDDDGRLIEKRQTTPDGEAVWTYEWNAKGFLAAFVAPGGARTEFLYDPYDRRIRKTRYDTDESSRVASTTRFVWDGNTLAHELREQATDVGDPIVEERTYCFEDGRQVPWAHRTTVGGGGDARRTTWFHYVNDLIGTPEQIVANDGTVACELHRDAWGRTEARGSEEASTPLRFQGQYEDAETGLHYNRFRYYDPETGRYISQDPRGPSGGFNLYEYGVNPNAWVDPFGLVHLCDVTYPDGSTATENSLWPDTWKGKNGLVATGQMDKADARRECHTEWKACDKADAMGGGDLSMKGQRPPCDPCIGRMREYKSNNPTSNVQYSWSAGKDAAKIGKQGYGADGSWPAGSMTF